MFYFNSLQAQVENLELRQGRKSEWPHSQNNQGYRLRFWILFLKMNKLFRVRGWLLAACDGKTGLVPANYIKILGKTEGKQLQQPDVIQQVLD